MKSRKAPQQLLSEVQMFRVRVASADSKVKMMREQAREAKRRRKEAKRNAQLVRRRFKQSKADLSELREALAKAETKLYQAGGRALARKKSQARRAMQTHVRKSKIAKPARPTRRSPALSRKSVRTVAKRKTGNDRAVSSAQQLDPALEAATGNPALSSLESITTGEPTPNAATEPL